MEEVTAGKREGREDRSDAQAAQVPRYTFSFHLLGALSEIEKQEERKKRKKMRRERRAHFDQVGKNFGHSPDGALIGQGLLSVRFARSRFAISFLKREKKKETRCKGKRDCGRQRERRIPAVVHR